MVVLNSEFDEFIDKLYDEHKRIVCYGAGMLPHYTKELFVEYGIADKIECFVDKNLELIGEKIQYGSNYILIQSPQILRTLDCKKYYILIMVDDFNSVLNELKQWIDLTKWECYVYAVLNASFFHSKMRIDICPMGEPVIPKVIHYLWFGRGEKPQLYNECINSWKEACPDYQIVEWNEDNYDVYKNKYIKEAYEQKKWAYVTDYARLDILNTYGGVYLDTDVKLFKTLDNLLYTQTFICFGEWPVPNSGAGIGSVANSFILQEMMSERKKINFVNEKGICDRKTNSNYEADILKKYGFKMNFDYQERSGVTLYPPDIIAPISKVNEKIFITERTIGVHYCSNSWRNTND